MQVFFHRGNPAEPEGNSGRVERVSYHMEVRTLYARRIFTEKCKKYCLDRVPDCDLEEAAALEESEQVNVRNLIEAGRSKIYHPLKPARMPGPIHVIPNLD